MVHLPNRGHTALRLALRIKGENDGKPQKTLSRGESYFAGGKKWATKESALRSARIINSVLEPHDSGELAAGPPIFQGDSVGLYGLNKTRKAPVPIPIHLRSLRGTPVFTQHPVQGQLCRHPQCARTAKGSHILRANVVLESGREAIG